MSELDQISADGCPTELHKLGRCLAREAARDAEVATSPDPIAAILAVECNRHYAAAGVGCLGYERDDSYTFCASRIRDALGRKP